MARQEFADGGYIGKLGNTVGQHWHNIRYVRTYVVPHDPKTPAQVATRNDFARCVRLAQAAMLWQRGAPMWQAPDLGEFANRVSYSRRAMIRGVPFLQCFPAFPDAYTDYYIYDDMQVSYDAPTRIIHLHAVDPVPTAGREIRIIIVLYNPAISRIVNIAHKSQEDSSGTIDTDILVDPGLDIAQDCYIVGGSSDWDTRPDDWRWFPAHLIQ